MNNQFFQSKVIKEIICTLSLIGLLLPDKLFGIPEKSHKNAVTYETTAGRFGDNLLSYLHAKWFSYKYDLPLRYRPFSYSDELALCKNHIPYSKYERFARVINFNQDDPLLIQNAKSTLFIVPYFPESEYEKKNGVSYNGGKWECLFIDWQDPEFRKQVWEDLAPLRVLSLIPTHKERISVAVHARRGGFYDDEQTRRQFPMKFVSDEFFIEQIKNLYYLLEEKPLHVFLFTDDLDPQALVKKYKYYLYELDIIIDCRKGENSDRLNVLEDFFSMMKFDCLIHTDSNYSLIPSLLIDYQISIQPASFKTVDGKIIYDKVAVKKRKNKTSL